LIDALESNQLEKLEKVLKKAEKSLKKNKMDVTSSRLSDTLAICRNRVKVLQVIKKVDEAASRSIVTEPVHTQRQLEELQNLINEALVTGAKDSDLSFAQKRLQKIQSVRERQKEDAEMKRRLAEEEAVEQKLREEEKLRAREEKERRKKEEEQERKKKDEEKRKKDEEEKQKLETEKAEKLRKEEERKEMEKAEKLKKQEEEERHRKQMEKVDKAKKEEKERNQNREQEQQQPKAEMKDPKKNKKKSKVKSERKWTWKKSLRNSKQESKDFSSSPESSSSQFKINVLPPTLKGGLAPQLLDELKQSGDERKSVPPISSVGDSADEEATDSDESTDTDEEFQPSVRQNIFRQQDSQPQGVSIEEKSRPVSLIAKKQRSTCFFNCSVSRWCPLTKENHQKN